ncbi:hypothetical protein DPMN_149811 [Dreissena polymorpha]|uniref:Uncharacterized protein n=1 Tax=Dreissena polymorpha TaxID=45954 RepID=A0A9D4FF49_DREPO|nr:hypothetical protein DPMN_149811 [Dreissena polymorpha]
MKSAKALPRYSSGHKSAGQREGQKDRRTERQTDRQCQYNIPPPMAEDKNFAHLRGETNVLSKFHENWAKNVTSTVFTCFHYVHIEKNAPPTGGHVFSPIPTIFKLVRDINKTNVLTNFHDDWAKIVTSRVFARENCHHIHIEENAPPTGGHFFCTDLDHFQTRPRHQLNQLFTRKTAPPTGGHTNILTNFELGRDFIGTKLLTKFHKDGTRNVASRVFTSKCQWTDGRTYDGQRPVTKAHLSNQVS